MNRALPIKIANQALPIQTSNIAYVYKPTITEIIINGLPVFYCPKDNPEHNAQFVLILFSGINVGYVE